MPTPSFFCLAFLLVPPFFPLSSLSSLCLPIPPCVYLFFLSFCLLSSFGICLSYLPILPLHLSFAIFLPSPPSPSPSPAPPLPPISPCSILHPCKKEPLRRLWHDYRGYQGRVLGGAGRSPRHGLVGH